MAGPAGTSAASECLVLNQLTDVFLGSDDRQYWFLECPTFGLLQHSSSPG